MKTNRTAFKLFVGICVFYPFCFLLNALLPFPDVFGKSFYVIVTTLLLGILFFSHFRIVLSRMTPAYLVLLTLPVVLALCMRGLIYMESFSDIVAARSAITLVLYFGLTNIFTLGPRERGIVRNVIIAGAAIQALIGIMHFYFFPHLVTNSTYLAEGEVPFRTLSVFGTARESGILLGANVYGHFILLGVIAVLFGVSRARPLSLRQYALILIMGWGLALSGSRFPIGVCFFLLTMFLMRSLSVRSFAFLSAIVAVSMFMLSSLLGHALNRMMVSDGRMSKNILALELLTQTPSHFFVGVPNDLVSAAITADGLEISDNSFLLLGINFGIPVALVWIAGFIAVLKRHFSFSKNAFLLVCLTGVLWLNNAVLWDFWWLYFFGLLFAIQRDEAPIENLASAGTSLVTAR